jgi:UDP-N-acetylmuramoyl-tripeptide--D-alanyl-D-alanine ligase
MRMTLAAAAAGIGARHLGADPGFSQVSTDSRTLAPGALFVALKGARFDGHDHLADAVARGAAAAIVSRPIQAAIPLLLVPDTRLALGELARLWRERAAPRVLALTGSNGKTTVKEMAAAILGRLGETLATIGNLNNDVGVPLTLLGLQGQAFAVIEMGANHPGEIAYLTRIACPDVALLNNAGAAHLEGFGSLEGVARGKAEILEGLGGDGVLVLNADDAYAGLWQRLAAARGRRTRTFGIREPADVRSPEAEAQMCWVDGGFRSRFRVCTPEGEIEVEMALGGRHNRMNALAAVAACQLFGADAEAIRGGLASLRPVRGRLQPRRGVGGMQLIDDSYNANPDSVSAAIGVLGTAPGRRILVLGDLAELGPGAPALHAELGERARRGGVERLYGTGPLSRAAVEAFGAGGIWLEERDGLVEVLRATCGEGDFLLIKGSRSSRMDLLADALAAEGG